MDIHQMRQFVAVAESKSMTAAAKKLGVSQPSLSQAIKKLESNIGVSLFDRQGKALTLNDYGIILLGQANIAFRSMDNAMKEISDSGGCGQRNLRIVCRCAMGTTARLFNEYNRRHPEITVSCSTPGITTRETDYDIEFFTADQPLQDNNVLPICNEDYVICVARKNRLATHDYLALRDLAKERFILSPAPGEMNNTISGMFKEAGFSPRVRMYHSYYNDILSLVEQGEGICIGGDTTWFIASDFDVVPIKIQDVQRSRTIYARWPAHAYLSETSLDLITYLSEKFRAFSDSRKLPR